MDLNLAPVVAVLPMGDGIAGLGSAVPHGSSACGIFRSFGARRGGLTSARRAADTQSMLDFVAQELVGSEEWRRVLEAYQGPQGRRNEADSAEDRWLPRAPGIAGVDPAHLSSLHGKLIALGFLKFEISGKTGMQYQLTSIGRQSLERGLGTDADLEPSAEVSGESDA